MLAEATEQLGPPGQVFRAVGSQRLKVAGVGGLVHWGLGVVGFEGFGIHQPSATVATLPHLEEKMANTLLAQQAPYAPLSKAYS